MPKRKATTAAFQIEEAQQDALPIALEDENSSLPALIHTSNAPSVSDIQSQLVRPMLGDLIRQKGELEDELVEVKNKYTKQQRNFLLELLQVADSLDRQITQIAPSSDAASHLSSIRNKLLQVLQREDVQPILISPGQIFDPELAEVSDREIRPDLPAYTIIAVERRGYSWQSTIIRPARVIISTIQ